MHDHLDIYDPMKAIRRRLRRTLTIALALVIAWVFAVIELVEVA